MNRWIDGEKEGGEEDETLILLCHDLGGLLVILWK